MTLMTAAGQGKADLVSAQLACGIDPRELELGGISALEGPQEALGFVFTQGPGPLDVRRRQARTALVTAAESGQAELVRWLLERGADPRSRERDGMRALDGAAHRGDQAVVEVLLAHDPELLDLPGLGERTALLAAVAGQHVPLVRFLLALGTDPCRWAADGTRALDQAARDGQRELAELLLARDARLLDLPGYGERTPLIAAAGGGHAELVHILVERGADPRRQAADGTRALDCAARNGYQAVVEGLLAHDPALLDLPGRGEQTALLAAAGGGHAGLARWLLERGADSRWRASDGTHALELASRNGHLPVSEVLLAYDPLLRDLPGRGERTALCVAAAGGHLGLMQRLLAARASPRRRAATVAHPLDTAAEAGHVSVVEQLLAHDPELLELPGSRERSALIAAAGGGHMELVQLLLARGADPRRRQSDGARALDRAAAAGDRAVVEHLLAHDHWLLDLPGKGERTALGAAAAGGHAALVGLLLTRGADPCRRSPDGGHALEAACSQGRGPVAEALLAHDPRLVDLPGWHERTALCAAADAGHAELVRFLLARGADPRRRDVDGCSALYFAARNGHQAVVTQLLEFDPSLLDLPVVTAAERLIDLPRWLLPSHPGMHTTQGLNVIEVLILTRRSAGALGLLRRHGSRINAAGIGGMTPLMLCAATAQSELTVWLLAHGADATLRDRSRNHALLHALEQHAMDCARVLIEHDPRLAHLAGQGGCTPFMAVAQMLATAGSAALRAGPEQLRALMHRA
jgi:ankyrin repeat protein